MVGARPQFVKLAAMARALAAQPGAEHVIVHTGQHYDHVMSDVFFDDLAIPAPDVNLGIGGGGHGQQTGAMLAGLEPVLQQHAPDWVLVYGDTNSTLAAAVAAVKLHLPVAHLEAGLRSFNRAMPEEHNRVLTDHAADLLLAPTQVAAGHLAREGLAGRTVVVGDVMTDICFSVRDAVRARQELLPTAVDASLPYVVATIHRAENTDDPQRLAQVLAGLAAVPVPVLLLAHPRLLQRAKDFGLDVAAGSIVVAEPLAYPQMVAAVLASAGVVTDSGGLQKEAFLLGVPVVTVRTETEWVETLADGWNVLDPDAGSLAQLAVRPAPETARAMPYGAGDAAERAVQALLQWQGRAQA